MRICLLLFPKFLPVTSYSITFRIQAEMRFCIIIPSYNHNDTLYEVLKSIEGVLPGGVAVIVVDDGSEPPVCLSNPSRILMRIAQNSGKANAMRVGFKRAAEMGFTHAVTMDADGQHPASALPGIVRAAIDNPDSVIVGVRNFDLPQVPKIRRTFNKFSNFWFRHQTGIEMADTQCGFRCYPLSVIDAVDVPFKGFVFEAELLVKASWAGVPIVQFPIPTIYTEESVKKSHYKPLKDTMRFSVLNAKLTFMAAFFPKRLLRRISLKKAKKA